MDRRNTIRFACAAALTCGAVAAGARAQTFVNGGFEAGLTGWNTVSQIGSDGAFFSQSGTASPVNAFAVPAPPEGLRAAMTDAGAGGSYALYQDFVVPNLAPAATLSFSLYVNNRAGAYFTPTNLDWAATNQNGNLILNQQARVDIIAPSADVFSVAAGSVLQNLFQTTAQTPLVFGYDEFSVDVTALLQARPGETLRLRFAETDNVNFFNFGVDNVRLNVIPEPTTGLLMLIALAGRVGRRR